MINEKNGGELPLFKKILKIIETIFKNQVYFMHMRLLISLSTLLFFQ